MSKVLNYKRNYFLNIFLSTGFHFWAFLYKTVCVKKKYIFFLNVGSGAFAHVALPNNRACLVSGRYSNPKDKLYIFYKFNVLKYYTEFQ